MIIAWYEAEWRIKSIQNYDMNEKQKQEAENQRLKSNSSRQGKKYGR